MARAEANWERLVRAALHGERIVDAYGHPVTGIARNVPSSLGNNVHIEEVLRAADEILRAFLAHRTVQGLMGSQPHLVNIQFQKKVQLQLVVLYVDFKLDESYTPSKISIRAGDGLHNLKEIKTMELAKPVGWVHISLPGADPREIFIHTFMLQIVVLSNHLNGRNTHV